MITWLKKHFTPSKLDTAVTTAGADRLRVLAPSDSSSYKEQGDRQVKAGQWEAAAQSYRQALEIDAQDAETHNKLGDIYYERQALPEAETCYRQALKIKPDDNEAQINLGLTLDEQGRHAEAEACYRQVVTQKPEHALAHFNLGIALTSQGRLVEAEQSYRRALEIKPNFSHAHFKLGAMLQKQERLAEAEASYRSVLEINPRNADALCNLGVILEIQDRLLEAEACYRLTLEIKPDFAAVLRNLGVVFNKRDKFVEAETCFLRVLNGMPNDVEALFGVAIALHKQGKLVDAEDRYRRVLQIKPDYLDAQICLGANLQMQERLVEAEVVFRRVLEVNRDVAEVHNNMGLISESQGKSSEAAASYRYALELNPAYVEAYGNLFQCLSHYESVDAHVLFEAHRRFGEQFESPLRGDWPQHSNLRDPNRRLQIGFVSPDLHRHAVMYFFEPLLTHLLGFSDLSLNVYYNNTIEDQVTRRLRGGVKQWHSIAHLTDAAVAQKIAEDGIDILIDLSGHTRKNRLLSFARKPAPVQASWMGYQGTTGLQAMDYYLADGFLVPSGQFDTQFTEKLVRLPANAPFLPSGEAPPVNTLPTLDNGFITFGSFNRTNKLSIDVIALWSQLLRALPTARMLLGNMPSEDVSEMLIDWFAQEGIIRERLSFYPRTDTAAYLALHHQVDVCLDTFPFTGGITTMHAIWMGVPTLTLVGKTVAGRQGASYAWHLGLDGFVAHGGEDFVQKGLAIADDIASLVDVRFGLRKRFEQSAMGRPDVIAEGLERAFRIIWRRWCAGLPAESFEVALQDVATEQREGFPLVKGKD
jgi:protein O-GlcNAc transferase